MRRKIDLVGEIWQRIDSQNKRQSVIVSGPTRYGVLKSAIFHPRAVSSCQFLLPFCSFALIEILDWDLLGQPNVCPTAMEVESKKYQGSYHVIVSLYGPLCLIMWMVFHTMDLFSSVTSVSIPSLQWFKYQALKITFFMHGDFSAKLHQIAMLFYSQRF